MPLSPQFTPLHSLLGGAMLASSVHSMLVQIGTVLGISGFMHASIGSVLPSSSKNSKRKHLKKNSTILNSKSNSNGESEPLISKEDESQAISDKTAVTTARLFMAGIISGGLFLGLFRSTLEDHLGTKIFDPPATVTAPTGDSAPASFKELIVWGALVGFGTKLGAGCTSGHFLCGLSRLSPRSIVATACFFSAAVATHLYFTEPTSSPDLLLRATTTAGNMIRLPGLPSVVMLQAPALLHAIFVPHILTREKAHDTPETLALKHFLGARITAFATGVHFALGLALTGMLRPSKVLGFLSLSPTRIMSGEWDPSLALVAAGGILPAAYGYFAHVQHKVVASAEKLIEEITDGDAEEEQQHSNRTTASRTASTTPQPHAHTHAHAHTTKPLLHHAAPHWRLPQTQKIDSKLILGSLVFGIGWGFSGFCPGPLLVNLGANAITAGQALPQFAVFATSMAVAGQVASLLV